MSLSTEHKISKAPIRRIVKVQFALVDPDEWRQRSVTKADKTRAKKDGIWIPGVEEFDEEGNTIYGNLNDPRLGTIFDGRPCETCSEGKTDCPGHWGHIELERAILHPEFIKVIMDILTCICTKCSKLRLNPNHEKPKADHQVLKRLLDSPVKSREQRLFRLKALCEKAKKCDHCGHFLPKFSRNPANPLQILEQRREVDDNDHARDRDKTSMSGEDCRKVFSKISRHTRRQLGFNNERHGKPEWLLLTVLPVAPPHVRPSVRFGSKSSHDDLTSNYAEIIKANNEFRSVISQEHGKRTREAEDVLTWHIATLFNNERGGVAQNQQRGDKRPLRTLRSRIVGKAGRVRGNLMGKRVDFSGRTVITADPNLLIGQVGVPESIAKTLTFPERVTTFNREWLQTFMRNGYDTYPGANFIVKKQNNATLDLRYQDTEHTTLEIGDIVERHIQDGDFMLFNRQPSLHKMSIMGHQVKVLKYSTFRLNLTCTAPYNADFDGDEMNMHIPQNHQARADVMTLMYSPTLIVSPQANRPVMGIVQDTLLGAAKMTARDQFVGKEQVFNLLLWIATWNGRVPFPAVMVRDDVNRARRGRRQAKFVPWWTGKQLFSLILPTINITKKNKIQSQITRCQFPGCRDPDDQKPREVVKLVDFCQMHLREVNSRCFPEDESWTAHQKARNLADIEEHERTMTRSDGAVLIVGGEHLTGVIDKSTIGAGQGEENIIHVIANDFPYEYPQNFIASIQKLVNNWLLLHGFSVGVQDTVASPQTLVTISEIIEKAKRQVETIIQNASNNVGADGGHFQLEPGLNMIETVEKLSMQQLNEVYNNAGNRALESIGADNNFGATVLSGSKGSNNNICQIMACVGQQSVRGQRIPCGFQSRTLPHFCKDDLSAPAKGFCENSYLKGLTPQEMFFHAMGGREGIIDTAVKTAKTGYIQRKLVKSMEDISVRYDGTVRNGKDQVIQFLYGEDGMDGRWIETQRFPTMSITRAKFRSMYEFNLDSDHFADMRAHPGKHFLLPHVIENMQTPAAREILEGEITQLKRDILDLKESASARGTKQRDSPMWYAPVHLGRLVKSVQQEHHIRLSKPTDIDPIYVIEQVASLLRRLVVVNGNDALSLDAQHNATMLFAVLVRSTLASKRVCKEYRLNKVAFDFIITRIETKFNEALVAPAEMCGVVAAQSLGEPTTQMTLNTFHNAGNSEHNVTLGVPRLEEILDVKKDISTPTMDIFLKPELATDEGARNEARPKIVRMSLRDVTVWTGVYYDPGDKTRIEADKGWFDDEIDLAEDVPQNLSPWVLRLELHRAKLDAAKLDAGKVKERLERHAVGIMFIVASTNVMEEAVLRIQVINSDSKSDLELLQFTIALEKDIIRDLEIQGVPGIKEVYIRKDPIGNPFEFSDHPRDREKESMAYTDGSNFDGLLDVECVDHARVTTNDVHETFTYLGIEAARACILSEIRKITSSTYINYRHMAMLVDNMTFRGYIMPIARYGLNRVDSGPLMRCSFEETCEILMRAAAFTEHDPVKGVTERIMLGQMCAAGSGAMDMFLDVAKLKHAIVAEEPGNVKFDAFVGTAGGAKHAVKDEIGGDDGDDAAKTFFMSGDGNDDDAGYDRSPVLADDAHSPGMVYSPEIASNGSPLYRAGSPASPRYAGSPGYDPASPAYDPASPAYDPSSPAYDPASPAFDAASPAYSPTSPAFNPSSPAQAQASPAYSPTSPAYSPSSPAYSPTSPAYTSGRGRDGRKAQSPSYQPTSPAYSPSSPAYSPSSPAYSPSSPAYSPSSPAYSPSSPAYSPSSPAYSPSSPAYSPSSPAYSPTSPAYSPSSPSVAPGSSKRASSGSARKPYKKKSRKGSSPGYQPTSPAYSPTSPAYSPSSPAYSPSSPAYSPSSPAYSPSSPAYSPSSPAYSPSSPAYSPSSPAYSPSSPAYSPSSPAYSPSSPAYSPSSPAYSPSSPAYSPSSPAYSPSSPAYSPSSPAYSPHSPRGDGDRDSKKRDRDSQA